MFDRTNKDRAFNLGCQARLDGQSSIHCPYSTDERGLRTLWQEGWKHIHTQWGTDAQGRVRQLPLVMEPYHSIP